MNADRAKISDAEVMQDRLRAPVFRRVLDGALAGRPQRLGRMPGRRVMALRAAGDQRVLGPAMLLPLL